MNVTIGRAPPLKSTLAYVSQRPGVISRLEIFDDFAAAAPHWRALESTSPLTTPYQRYDFLDAWHRHLGQRAGVRPFLIVGYDATGEPMLLCPFGAVRCGPLQVGSFLGGRHANFNVALWRRDAASLAGQADLAAILSRIAAAPGRGIDLMVLTSQPHTWSGRPNPFLLWPHQPSPSFGYYGNLKSPFEELLHQRLGYAARKKLRKKMRVLGEHSPVHFRRAETPQQVRAMLEIFYTQQAERMRTRGVRNTFAAPGTHPFIEELATARPHGKSPLIEIYTLSAGDTVVATIGGMVGGARFCAMFNSITSGPLMHESPGDQLLVYLMQALCERGLDSFDLGVGDARYKRRFCDVTDPLFDNFIPLTPLGRLAAPAFRYAHDAKRLIKGSPSLWRIVQALRHLRTRLS